MTKNKTAIDYLERENERMREDSEKIKKYCKYLLSKLDIDDSEKYILKDLLNRW